MIFGKEYHTSSRLTEDIGIGDWPYWTPAAAACNADHAGHAHEKVPRPVWVRIAINGRDLTRSQTAMTIALFRSRHGPSAALFNVQRS